MQLAIYLPCNKHKTTLAALCFGGCGATGSVSDSMVGVFDMDCAGKVEDFFPVFSLLPALHSFLASEANHIANSLRLLCPTLEALKRKDLARSGLGT